MGRVKGGGGGALRASSSDTCGRVRYVQLLPGAQQQAQIQTQRQLLRGLIASVAVGEDVFIACHGKAFHPGFFRENFPVKE